LSYLQRLAKQYWICKELFKSLVTKRPYLREFTGFPGKYIFKLQNAIIVLITQFTQKNHVLKGDFPFWRNFAVFDSFLSP